MPTFELPDDSVVDKEYLNEALDNLVSTFQEKLNIEHNGITDRIATFTKHYSSPLYLQERFALSEEENGFEKTKVELTTQLQKFNERFESQIQSGQEVKTSFAEAQQEFIRRLATTTQHLEYGLRQIDEKYSQNEHNPTDLALISEKRDQIESLKSENKRLYEVLSTVTTLPNNFDFSSPDQNVWLNAAKTQLQSLARRLEEQLKDLVNDAPWHVLGVLHPHLDEEEVIRSSKYDTMAMISHFIFICGPIFRRHRKAQPRTDLFVNHFPAEYASQLEDILLTRIKQDITIVERVTLRSRIISLLSTFSDFCTYFGDSELGKVFHWAHSDQLDFDTQGTDQFREYWNTLDNSHPTRQMARVIFGAVLYIEPGSPVGTFSVLHRGSIYYCEDLPKMVEENALRSGAVEDILIRSTVAPIDPTYGLFDMRRIQLERLLFVTRLSRHLKKRIAAFSGEFVTAVEAYPADAIETRPSDLAVETLRVRLVNGLSKAIADWIATFLNSLRLDPIEEETRTRRVLGSLLLVVQSYLKEQLRDILTNGSDVDETANHFIHGKMASGEPLNNSLHNILEAGHHFSRFINRYSQVGVQFRWHQFPVSANPWVADHQNWKCVLCRDDTCELPNAPNGRVIFGKVNVLVTGHDRSPEGGMIMHDYPVETGWYEHGQNFAFPGPRMPPAPTAETVSDDEL